MKAITLWQPYASLIAVGAKEFETRSWPTKFRGELAIHAAKVEKYPPTGVTAVMKEFGIKSYEMSYGAVVCIVEMVDCIEMDRDLIAQQSIRESTVGDWSIGRYAWEFANIRVLEEPYKVRGAQLLWEWDPQYALKYTN